jgi:hypothetical protein
MNKIERLKKKAAKYYQQYHKSLDSLGCGKTLGEHISSTASEARANFNTTMDELSKLDPSCPTKRL